MTSGVVKKRAQRPYLTPEMYSQTLDQVQILNGRLINCRLAAKHAVEINSLMQRNNLEVTVLTETCLSGRTTPIIDELVP